MTKNNNKGSAKKKLLPAAAMLTTSAVMLSTATYAWFTMSREVEVTGIQMTATTPEDIQISLGKLAITGTPTTAETAENGVSLGASTGVLYASSGTAGDGNAVAPENSWDWSNSADISAYYDIGRLIPASSYDGTEIFFTPDASGVGKTVKGNATYIQATNKLAAVNDKGSGTNKTYKATLHALTDTRAVDDWAKTDYSQSASYDKTNDDGYYVDIPVWLRTSSNTAVNLSVDGYVLPGSLNTGDNASNKETDLELYRAVRVAILDGAVVTADDATGAVACGAGDAAVSAGNNIIPLKDAWDTSQNVTDGNFSAITAYAAPFDNSRKSILDSLNYKRAIGGNSTMSDTDLYGVSALGSSTQASDGSSYIPATYSEYTAITPTSAASPSTVATVAGSTTGKDYGEAKKLIIRVWLDGEDKECWNDNAGQDWAISLKFSKIDSTPVSP